MAAGDVFKVTISATGQGSIYQNTFHVQTLTATAPDASTFLSFVNDYIAMVRPHTSNTVTWTEWEAVQQWGAGMTVNAGACTRSGGVQFGNALTGSVGAKTDDALPPQNSLVFTWLTGFSGRRKRGRTFMFGGVESNQLAGEWLTAYTAVLQTALTAFLNIYKVPGGTSPTLSMGIWSERTATGCVQATPPSHGHVQVDTPLPAQAYTAISSGLIRQTVYSQRRRTRGVGR